MADWLSPKEQIFEETCIKWIEVLGDEPSQTTFEIKPAECEAVLEKIEIFLEARAAYKKDDSSTRRIIKDEAKTAAKTAMRRFANLFIRFNEKMDDSAKTYLGLGQRDNTPTAHHPPTSMPITVVENTVNRFEHKITASNRDTRLPKKPADAYGVRYAWLVGGARPASGKHLPSGRFSRKTSLVVTHSEENMGQSVWYATCYENAKGDAGPWSPVEQAIIG